jgi:hypothetical protein
MMDSRRGIANQIAGLPDPGYRLKRVKSDARNFVLGYEVSNPLRDVEELVRLFEGCIDRVEAGDAPASKLGQYRVELESAKELIRLLK